MALTDSSLSMRAPDRVLALLRMVVGFWFFKSIATKFAFTALWGVLPVPSASARWVATMPKLLAKYAADNPIAWYKSFLLDTVIPHGAIFAHVTALGEVALGFCLLVGLFTPLAAALGLVQVVFYGLAVQHQSPGQLGFHVMLFSMMVAFILARAGRSWGVDGWLRARYPHAAIIHALT